MKKLYSIRKFSGLVLIAIFILSCEQKKETTSRVSTLPFYSEASFTPHWLASDSDELVSFHKVPSFSLTNQNGETITDKTFANKIYVTDFFFTSCPGICPKMTANMAVLQEAFKEDSEILLLSHSVTPETDSVPVLKTYAQEKGVDDNKWHLVTGPRSEIYSLGRNTYFVEEDLGEIKTDDDFLHTENFVLVDKNSHIRGIYNGLNKTSVNQLIADIKTLKSES
ncbi:MULTISPECIES: SCO family protein [Bizionia]|uniref:SCO family protein n=1 Tax=Bizionia algoritergicola TaxID=291187 RepID=A0A5D0R0W9_9FLAO|nr:MULTISPECIES: SCO family protein [Bizionia]OBX24242.1 electron transporter [Bizionia sp. APA-3]TYB75162.1 SCO family protein [Bizionia algoritergicola]